ncbi:MAG TPA: lipoyl(octanoyl) transferase LipB [Candidatus Saccharimonadales bacterium]|nr:lipoyl(octanoyl) transferase LipB [Candidatus Saccharimonadales bacterium]
MPAELRATALGRVGYLDGWRLQEAVAARLAAGGPERLLLLEHDPVYTIGRRGTLEHLTASPSELRAAGASVYRVDRGGDITYHGPGQLVGYPIMSLGEAPDVVAYVRAIEEGLRAALGDFGIASRTIDGKTGVWVTLRDGRDAKIAAIGVRVSRGVTRHGFALNVDTDLAPFARMIPCGFMHEVGSFARLGVAATIADVARACASRIAERLDRELVWDPTIASPRDDEIPDSAPVRDAVDLLAAVAA